MTIEIQGAISGFTQEFSGIGKNGTEWKRGGVIISVPDGGQIFVEAWNGNWDYCKTIKLGDVVRCKCVLESHEWKDRWYTHMGMVHLSLLSGVSKDAKTSYSHNDSVQDTVDPQDDLPF